MSLLDFTAYKTDSSYSSGESCYSPKESKHDGELFVKEMEYNSTALLVCKPDFKEPHRSSFQPSILRLYT